VLLAARLGEDARIPFADRLLTAAGMCPRAAGI